jgi:GT2 family glycosyltransferase
VSERSLQVGVVVLHYRHWPEVKLTLDALLAQDHPMRVVVVDNASADGSAEAIAAVYPGVKVVLAPSNDGYASGMNLGAAAVGHVDALLFLTHECVLAPEALGKLASRLEHDAGVGLVGPLLGWRSKPDVVWSGGGGLGRRTARPFHHQVPARIADWGTDPMDVPWIDGAAMLVRSTLFADLHGFDEGYFLYNEEVDLALRARARGWRVECCPAAIAWQEPGMAPPYLETRNRLRLLARTKGMRRHLIFAVADTAFTAGRGLLRPRVSQEHRHARLQLAGARDAVLGRLDKIKSGQR